jgi:hypothetical protein
MKPLICIPFALLVGACATPGSRPKDMSVSGHEVAARAEEQGAPAVDADSARERKAADHRAAAQTLRTEEQRACAGIPENERDASPLAAYELSSVAPLYSTPTKTAPQRLEGAVATVRAAPGVSGPWLQRLVDCHVARSAANHPTAAEMANCPLAVPGSEARVAPARAGFEISIRGEDREVAAEIWRRAQVLAAHTASR